MALILRHLRLAARTEDGDFVADLPFERKLVVLRADNSMGKSTCMQAILYALGMDAVLQQGHRVPLPPVMTEKLEDESGQELSVIESYVELEAENSAGEVVTFQRFAKRQSGDHRMLRAWADARLTAEATDAKPEELLARVAGSGVGDFGVTPFLNRFIGWEPPMILLPSGNEVPLYSELILPLFYVEQRRGWGGIQASMPSSYGIPEVKKRAIEFVLSLQAYEQERRAAVLRQLQAQHRAEWRSAVGGVGRQLAPLGLALRGLTDEISKEVPYPDVVTVPSGRGLDIEVQEIQEQVEGSDAPTAPAVMPSSSPPEDEIRLQEALSQLGRAQAQSAQYEQEISHQRAELDALRTHMIELERERRRNRDARRLEEFGSDQPWFQLAVECPVCHQELPGTLHSVSSRPLMTLDENVKHIDEQVRAYQAIEREIARAIEVADRAQQEEVRRVRDLRSEVRALRTTLVAPAGSPSAANIERRLRLENRLRELGQVEVYVGGLMNQLADIRAEADATEEELRALPRSGLSAADEERLAALESSFLEQIAEYQLSSFPVEALGISQESYRPEREGFDLGFDVSASDGIRIVWAYLLGLLEVARTFQTNHPGFLILDEPRQQSASAYSLSALLKRASAAGVSGQQVLFASSESLATLEPMLDGLDHQLLPITGRILKRAERGTYDPDRAG